MTRRATLVLMSRLLMPRMSLTLSLSLWKMLLLWLLRLSLSLLLVLLSLLLLLLLLLSMKRNSLWRPSGHRSRQSLLWLPRRLRPLLPPHHHHHCHRH
jgi:hypothetical protein